MGWLYTDGQTRRELIESRTKGWKSKSGSATCIAHCTRGNVLWAVWEIYRQSTGAFERLITCDLMQNYGGWGYKDMDESMHPFYYSCPLKYLKMVPEVQSQAWRNGVKKYHAKRKLKNQLTIHG